MRIARWGNSLAVRLPTAVVDALALNEGDDIEMHVLGDREIAIARRPSSTELIERLRQFEGRLPAGFVFDRLEAHERR